MRDSGAAAGRYPGLLAQFGQILGFTFVAALVLAYWNVASLLVGSQVSRSDPAGLAWFALFSFSIYALVVGLLVAAGLLLLRLSGWNGHGRDAGQAGGTG